MQRGRGEKLTATSPRSYHVRIISYANHSHYTPPPTPPRLRGSRGPLWGLGAGRQSVALAGWGSSGLISNQADMISVSVAEVLLPCPLLPCSPLPL